MMMDGSLRTNAAACAEKRGVISSYLLHRYMYMYMYM